MKILMQKISFPLIVNHFTIVIPVKIMPICFCFFFFTISCIPMPKRSCPVWETLHSHMFSHVWHTFCLRCVNLCCQKHQSAVSRSLWRQDLKTFSRPLMTGSNGIYNKSHIYPSSVLQLSSDMAIYTVIHLFFHSCQTHSGSHRLDSFSIPAVSLAHRELWELLPSYCSTPWARANRSLEGPDFPIRHTCEDKQLYSPDSSCPFNPIWVHLLQPRPYLLHTSCTDCELWSRGIPRSWEIQISLSSVAVQSVCINMQICTIVLSY